MRRADKRRCSRQSLLDAAAALMIERGSIEISLSDVAGRAQLNSALIRYYFGSKQGLLYELVLELVQAGVGQAEELVELDVSPVEKLKIHLRGIIRFHFRYPFINRLIQAMLEDPEQAKKVAERITIPLADMQRSVLVEGEQRGLFRKVDPMLFHIMVSGACDQIFAARRTLKFGFGVAEISEQLQRSYADEVVGIMLGGLLSPEALVVEQQAAA